MDIKLKENTISGLLKSGKTFKIPRFQREYSWQSVNNKEFFDDVVGYVSIKDDAIEKRQYFLGTMLFIGDFEASKQEVVVVDGQQRMTTITILLSALSDRFREIGTKEGETYSKKIFEYIMTEDNDGNSVRVLISESHYPFFSFYIQDRTKEEKCDVNTEEELCIKNTFEYFFDRLDEKKIRSFLQQRFPNADIKKMEYIELLKVVRDQVLNCSFVSISTTEKEQANTIFEILNAKGKHLSDEDLIKNRIFEVVKDTEPADFAQVHWDKVRKVLNDGGNGVGFNTFYIQFWRANYKKTTEKKLFADFKKLVSPATKERYKEFIIELEKNAKLYNIILNPTPDKFSRKKEFNTLIESLLAINDNFNIVLARIPILALYNAYDSGKIGKSILIKTIQEIEKFHFAYTSICSKKANKLDSLYSSFSICLKNAKKEECAKVIKEQLTDKLDALFPPYTEFEKGFTVLKYSGKKELTSNMKVKYIVNHINNYYSKTKESALDGSVEHIVSESEGEESQNIGNLILLEASINSSAGNEPYEIKKTDYYVNSNYKWIKQFIVEHEKWDISMAESRAVAMAELYYTKILGRGK